MLNNYPQFFSLLNKTQREINILLCVRSSNTFKLYQRNCSHAVRLKSAEFRTVALLFVTGSDTCAVYNRG